MRLNQLHGCEDHRSRSVGNLQVTACARCRMVEWSDALGEVDPAEGIAALFGNYELIGSLDALGCPAPEVLVYAPPSTKKRRHLEAFPKGEWVKAAPDLWLTHDGDNLVLATNHRVLFDNLTRGA